MRMRKIFLVAGLWMFINPANSQSVTQKLQRAFTEFERDHQLKNAISSLCVLDASTGQVVFEKNARVGLAPASTQKVITSITALELLGKDFQYQTKFFLNGDIRSAYTLLVEPSGDPTLGSWRWQSTGEKTVMDAVAKAVYDARKKIRGPFYVYNKGWNAESIPDGWIWQDIGNYYGAGASSLNWRENQFDLLLQSGNKIGDSVRVAGTIPADLNMTFQSELTSAARGTGDNAYIYFHNNGDRKAVVRGTIPVQENRFSISGAMSSPPGQFFSTLKKAIEVYFNNLNFDSVATIYHPLEKENILVHTVVSPTLDSIIYWFNKRSINLYGEALIKTLGFIKKQTGSTEEGISVLKDYWKENKLDIDELGMVDGSGLSPQNRVTTHAMTEIIKYAMSREWFPVFLNSLPEFNGMLMKSGTIRGVKGFAGYHKAKNGKEYIFSFLVNNYNGSPSALVNKMYSVLNQLK